MYLKEIPKTFFLKLSRIYPTPPDGEPKNWVQIAPGVISSF